MIVDVIADYLGDACEAYEGFFYDWLDKKDAKKRAKKAKNKNNNEIVALDDKEIRYNILDLMVANKVVFNKQDNNFHGKKSGNLTVLIQKENEPGYRDFFTNDFYHYDDIINIKDNNIIYKKDIKDNKTYLCDKKDFREIIGLYNSHFSISKDELLKVMELSKKDDEELNLTLNNNKYYIGDLYKDNQYVGKKKIGTIMKTYQFIDNLDKNCDWKKHFHRFFVSYESNEEYLIIDNEPSEYKYKYEGYVIKNVIPLTEYLNKSKVSEDDVKKLNGKLSIVNEYNDIVLKTIADYKYLFNDNDQKYMAILIDKYYSDLKKFKTSNQRDEISELQRRYINTIYQYIVKRNQLSNTVDKEYITLKKTLNNK